MLKIHQREKKSSIKIMYTVRKDTTLEILVPPYGLYQLLRVNTVSHLACLLAYHVYIVCLG